MPYRFRVRANWAALRWYDKLTSKNSAHSSTNVERQSINDGNSWTNTFQLISTFVSQRKSSSPPIRIAVLDTGCDTNNMYFTLCPGAERRLEGRWLDLVSHSASPIDEDSKRHGTGIVTLLLGLLPSSEIFVVRVMKNNDDLESAGDRIAKVFYQPPRSTSTSTDV